MKILVLFLLISVQGLAQDKGLFNYVNTYRVANGVDELEWDDVLYEVSESNTNAMISNDSLMHSKTNTYECAVREFTLAPTAAKKLSFEEFLKDYFDMDYVDPAISKNEDDVIKYTVLYVVYAWHLSDAHRDVMLSDDATIGSTSIYIGKISFKSNKRVIGGKVLEFKKFISHYEVKHFATLNLNI